MIGLSWRYRRPCLAVLTVQVLLLAISLSGLGLTGLAIDLLRHQLDPANAPPHWPLGFAPPSTWSTMASISLIAGAIVVLALINTLLRYLSAVAVAELTQRVIVHLRAAVYDKLQRLSFRFFDSNDSSSIINRVAIDVPTIPMFIEGVILRIIIVVLSLGVYLIYMLSVHAPLTLACLAVTPLLWYGAVVFSRTVQPAYTRNAKLMDQMVLTFKENVQGIHVVKGFAREEEQIAKFAQANQKILEQKQRIFWTLSIFQPAMGFLTQLNTLVLLGYGGYLVVRGELLLGSGLYVFACLLQEFANQVGQITNITNSIQSSLAGAQRVFEVLDAPVEMVSPPEAIRLPKARGAIRFESVSFSYLPDAPVLEDLSFDVRPGECVAIVGATGSGKSTLLSLIPRFYDATRGRVTIDGIDVRRLDLDDLRRNIGIVFQESFLFTDTVGANIAFGRPEATDDLIDQAAQTAAASQFIRELPEGYETLVIEQGSNLSGGQRQRLAIARALLLNPPILILDDATAAVDSRTELEIQRAISSAMRGRTTVLVANRLSTLRRADKIIVLDKGRIAAMGTHEQLLERSEQYRNLALLQSSGIERPPQWAVVG
jgi:ATP-binding cassette subfamily B protein